MGGSLITIVAGVITSPALAFLLRYYIKQRKRAKQAPIAVPPLSPQEARKARRQRVIAYVLLVVGLSLIIYDCFLWFPIVSNAPTVCAANTGASFTVNSPTDHQEVDRLTTMYGTACNLVRGQHAWPITLAETTNVYYLLGNELTITDAHTWSTEITLGDTSESVRGHPYMVSVIIVNDATNAILNSIISKRNTKYIIPPDIPRHAQTMFTITLIRK